MKYRYLSFLMHRPISCICLFFLLLPSFGMAQGKADVRHYVTTSLSGAYVLPVGDFSHLRKFDGASGQLTVGYELAWQHLLVQTGIGAQINRYGLRAEDYTTSVKTWDTQGTDFIYTYHFHDRKENASVTSLSVPLLAGGKWSYFYFLSGLVGTFRIYDKGATTALVSCTGDYSQYMGDFAEMDNHAFYKDEPLSEQYNATYVQAKYQISPYIEVGADFSNAESALTGYRKNAHSEVRVRIAAFAQCGLLNEHTPAGYDYPYEPNTASPFDLQAIQIPSLMNNAYVSGSRLRNMYFGARITILFRAAGRSAYCVSCNY